MMENDSQETLEAHTSEDRGARILATLLRMVLMGGAALAIAWPLTPTSGSVAAAVGAALGIWLGEFVGRSRLRTWPLFVAPPLLLLALYVWTQSWVTWDWPSQSLGWTTALETAEVMRWGAGALFVLATLRAFARRHPSLNAVELLLPILAAASLLSAHRGGQIHRPQQLADWALEQGQDPTWYLLLLGLAGALFLAFGLLRLRRSSQFFGGLALIALLFTLGLWGVSELPYHAIAKSIRKMLGEGGKKRKKKPKPAKAKPGKGKGQQQRRRNDTQNQMPFQPNSQQQQQKQRQRPTAIVVFRDDYKPTSGVYYFRQQVLSQYNGVRLKESPGLDYDRDRAHFFPTADGAVDIPRSIEWDKRPKTQTPQLYRKLKTTKKKKLTLKQKTKAYTDFFLKQKKKKKKPKFSTVTTHVSLLQKHQKPFALVSARSLRALANPNQRLFLRSYEVLSRTWNGKWNLKVKFGETYWPKDVWSHYTTAPKDPRYESLRAKILKRLEGSPYQNNTMAKAIVLKTWLEKEAAYSMRIKTPPNVQDHTAHFLFKTRVGYCVHFSHAAVYLFRLSGIPARIAEGYAAQQRNRGGSSALLLRSAEAHAWPEVYVRGVGWVPLDIHPRRSLDPTTGTPDPDLRRLYSNLARPKRKMKGKNTAFRAMGRRTFPWGPMLGRFFLWVRNLGLVVLLLVFTFAFALKWTRRWGYLCLPSGPRRIIYFYHSLTDRLSELNQLREPGESLEGFAYRLRHHMPDFYALSERISAQSLGSQQQPDEEEKLLFQRINQQFRSTYPWYQRMLQFVRPFAWSRHIWQRWQHNPPPALLKWYAFRDRAGAFLRRTLPIFRRTPA